MSSNSRKHRGYRTQKVVAEYLKTNGWPYAESTGASRQGADITGTPDLSIEIKARTNLNPLAWIKQAEQAANGRLPIAIFRSNGQGENVPTYLALLRVSDLTNLLHAAGYGDPPPKEEGTPQ